LGKGVAQTLLAQGETRVCEVSPQRTVQYCRHGRSQDKTDDVDALASARLLVAEGEHLPVVRRDDLSAELRLLSDHRDNMLAERTRLINQLRAQMLQVTPLYKEESGLLTEARGVQYGRDLVVPAANRVLHTRLLIVHQLTTQLVSLDREIAAKRPGGAVGRGPKRYYVEIHPEEIRGFLDLVTHPWVAAVSRAVLGPDYKIVEIGFDVPLPGAVDQPWHRDFPAPEDTLTRRRLNSLAFNLTTVDVCEDMGPFEVAPGTQWDDPTLFEHDMFPPKALYGRYEQRAQRKMLRMGDISARSALTIHRGTANHSDKQRPALVLGVDAPGANNAERHDLQLSWAYDETLPESVRQHLTCRVVERLEPIVQGHTIEGLMMGEA